jgi:hypothetical protein
VWVLRFTRLFNGRLLAVRPETLPKGFYRSSASFPPMIIFGRFRF